MTFVWLPLSCTKLNWILVGSEGGGSSGGQRGHWWAVVGDGGLQCGNHSLMSFDAASIAIPGHRFKLLSTK